MPDFLSRPAGQLAKLCCEAQFCLHKSDLVLPRAEAVLSECTHIHQEHGFPLPPQSCLFGNKLLGKLRNAGKQVNEYIGNS